MGIMFRYLTPQERPEHAPVAQYVVECTGEDAKGREALLAALHSVTDDLGFKLMSFDTETLSYARTGGEEPGELTFDYSNRRMIYVTSLDVYDANMVFDMAIVVYFAKQKKRQSA